ncbi:hypothetical protein WA026_021309 [Henosepilachna vigintioctopunctata]|uniref:Uncharacterized protein n=1 Tax=Henosepilachna vigintioctopunctata TaxID=420089 RepID=A0AAW1UB40_9CUCU
MIGKLTRKQKTSKKSFGIIHQNIQSIRNAVEQLEIFLKDHKDCKFGIPKVVISDSVPTASYECNVSASTCNFGIVTSSPNYPKGKGLAEKAVHILKLILNNACLVKAINSVNVIRVGQKTTIAGESEEEFANEKNEGLFSPRLRCDKEY